MDGNRTRRTGIARPNRFEGGGAHQVLGHLPGSTDPTGGVRQPTAQGRRVRCAGMKKRILVIALIVLTIVAAKKARHV